MTRRMEPAKDLPASAQAGLDGAVPRSTGVDTADELDTIRRELAATKLERDDYRQEMFESNRYAAWLTHQSRDLGGASKQVQPGEADQSGSKIEVSGYIAYLEEKLWAAETERLDSTRYVQYLEKLCWQLETRRLALASVSNG